MTEAGDYVRVTINMPPALKDRLDEEAKKQGRSSSLEGARRLAKSFGINLTGVPKKKK